jgi:Rrf2 family protein
MTSQTTEYALRAMVFLAEQGPQAVSSKDVAATTRVPCGYLSKVLGLLGRAGLVRSQRGLGGGFTLARPANRISVLEVVSVFEPIQRVTCCPLGRPDHTELCPLHRRLDEVAASIERVFGDLTLAELLDERLRFDARHQPHPDDPTRSDR